MKELKHFAQICQLIIKSLKSGIYATYLPTNLPTSGNTY